MISPSELRANIIKPTCDALAMGGAGVEELLLGTAMQESGCGLHLVQQGGPALGIFQMEPSTHDDLWTNFLAFRSDLKEKISVFTFGAMPKSGQLVGNLYYACIMARAQYFRSPRPIPSAGDLAGQAALYKAVYNTAGGAATIDEYIANARKALA